MKISSGRLRHRVTLQKVTETKDSMGGTRKAWTDFATNVPCDLMLIRGKERVAAGQLLSEISGTALLRYIPGVTSKMRLVESGVNYEIEAAVPDRMKQSIELTLTQGVSDG